MKTIQRCVRLCVLLSGGGLLLAGGCMAAIEQNLDTILSPGATENALTLPYSPAAELAQLFARLLVG